MRGIGPTNPCRGRELVSSLIHGAESPLRGPDPARCSTRVRGGILPTDRRIAGFLGIRFAFQSVADVRDRELIARAQPAGLNPLAVDPDAVGTAKVSNDDLAILLGH